MASPDIESHPLGGPSVQRERERVCVCVCVCVCVKIAYSGVHILLKYSLFESGPTFLVYEVYDIIISHGSVCDTVSISDCIKWTGRMNWKGFGWKGV
jgi:hypothetical protein